MTQPDLHTLVRRDGFDFIPARQMAAVLGPEAAAAWPVLAESWNDLGEDRFMADGGRYRRRRHAALSASKGAFVRKPHQPHYQSRDYNPLNGGVQRWFEPVTDATLANPAMQAVLAACDRMVTGEAGARDWHVELHQFRIEPEPGQTASPTPEGLHRDGVDWVFVMLIARENVAEGVTRIAGAGGDDDLDRFVLAEPMDAVFLDDRRVRHGVTPIQAVDPTRPAYRDALVITFAQTAPVGP
ncbi:2OG-Fe dioxygenase family protein [Phenylobacterium aquaticum]|uniref:2OG-Fe dioxygenase family protein n=1 Tax=Phenylobacterium aquaticum TaxID=1763816 RepID=UPI0030158751